MKEIIKRTFSALLSAILLYSLISCAALREEIKETKQTGTVEAIATVPEETTEAVATVETQHPETVPDGYYFNEYLGTTREKVLNWLTAHENDDYYLGTPYGNPDIGFSTDTCMRPNGRFANNDPYMTCTGFVIDVLLNSVNEGPERDAMLERMENMIVECEDNGWMYDTPYFTDIVNAFFWGAFAEEYNDGGIMTYKFDTVEEMLDSEILRKGDIVYFSPDTMPYGFDVNGDPVDIYGNTVDSHIGFYWGEDHSGEDLFWHSINDWYVDCPLKIFEGGYNMISPFASPSVVDYILVIPLK